MYIAEIVNQWRKRRGGAQPGGLPPTVYALGMTSMLTDVSTEMVLSILPVYLLAGLHLSTSQYGVLDGLLRGGAAVLALLLGGLLSQHARYWKWVAGIGYGLSAVSRLFLLLAGSFGPLALCLGLDRLGKGIRVAPRDAMLAASVPPSRLGMAFGVHRALDACGAMLGPLLAALILWWLPQGYMQVFLFSAGFALIGMLVFTRFVHPLQLEPADLERVVANKSERGWLAGLRADLLHSLPASVRRLLMLAAAMSFFTVSEGILYAWLQRGFALQPYIQPLLPVGSACVFLLLAAPCGKLADRFGSLKIFACGHLILLPVYAWLALGQSAESGLEPSLLLHAGFVIFALGGYFAATDGVLMAAVSAQTEGRTRALTLGVFAATLALSKFLSSSIFGWLWDQYDFAPALGIYALGLSLSLIMFWLGGKWAR